MGKKDRKPEESKERERILKSYWSNNYFKWNKTNINRQSYPLIEKLIKERDSKDNFSHTDKIEILNFGLGLCVNLSFSEFRKGIYDGTKFDNDYRMIILTNPMIKSSYFLRIEKDRLAEIKSVIEKCLVGTELYQKNNGYIGLCIYLEFLENYKPKRIVNKDEVENKHIDSNNKQREVRYFITSEKVEIIRKNYADDSPMAFIFHDKKYTIYSIVIKYLVSSPCVLQNYETKQDETVDTFKYLQAYVNGYEKGIEYFNKEFKVDANTLYSNNADAYVKNLLEKWQYSNDEMCFNKGWEVQSEIIQQVITFANIEKIGHVSGMRFAFSEFITDHQTIFEKYENATNKKKDFDTNDKTNPLIFDNILLTNLHREFNDNEFLVPIDYADFKNCFREKPQKIEFKKGISIVAICYIFGQIEFKNIGTSNFSDWMKYHVGNNPYRTKKEEYVQMEQDANIKKNGFELTKPQKKVISLKQNIDSRIKLILEKSP